MIESTAAEPPSDASGEATPSVPAPEVATAAAAPAEGAHVAVWILYVLGMIAAVVLAASLVFVVLAYVTSGGGGFGLDVSTPALVLWLSLAIAAGGTFVWRRYGRPK